MSIDLYRPERMTTTEAERLFSLVEDDLNDRDQVLLWAVGDWGVLYDIENGVCRILPHHEAFEEMRRVAGGRRWRAVAGDRWFVSDGYHHPDS